MASWIKNLVPVVLAVFSPCIFVHAAPAPKDSTGVLRGPLGGGAANKGAGRSEDETHYQSLFGADEKAALATASTHDDAAFAADLLKKVDTLVDEPGLVAIMYRKAYEFGIKDPAGYASAVQAAKWLQENAGGAETTGASEWRNKLHDVYRLELKKGAPAERAAAATVLIDELMAEADDFAAKRRYDEAYKVSKEASSIASSVRSGRSDEVATYAKAMQARQLIAAKAKRLMEKLDASPDDPALLNDVVDVYVNELDDAESALKVARRGHDQALQTTLGLAATDVQTLTEAQLLELARWYKQRAASAKPQVRAPLLCHALECYSQYLTLHDKQDVERLTATTEAEDAGKQMQSSAAAVSDVLLGDRILIWNGRNSTRNDRGTAAVNVILGFRGQPIWRRDNIAVPWDPKSDTFAVVRPPAIAFDAVRVEVIRWTQLGGGLAEIQVLHNGRDIAKGARTKASAQWSAVYPASAVTNGSTASAQPYTFWLLPDKTTGWIEVDLSPKTDAASK